MQNSASICMICASVYVDLCPPLYIRMYVCIHYVYNIQTLVCIEKDKHVQNSSFLALEDMGRGLVACGFKIVQFSPLACSSGSIMFISTLCC